VSSNGEAMRNRQAVAAGWFTVVPGSFVLDVGSAMKLRMIGVSDEEFKKMREYNPGFARYTIKAGTYKDQGIDGDVHTIQSPTILIASSKTPADVIYKVTKAIVEGRGEFASVSKVMEGVTPAHMAESFGMPYHPGAQRYYKEIGVLK
jgi:TRAP transporter TAXI family solute receptor